MRDMLDPILKDKKKLIVLGVGVAAALVVAVVLFVALSGGGDDDEIEFEFADVPAEPEISVEEQVELTIQARAPTDIPESTPDIPATLFAAGEQTRIALQGENSLNVPAPPGRPDPAVAFTLTPADIRYLDVLGRPLWLSVQSYFELKSIYGQLPGHYLVAANAPRIKSIASNMSRAEQLVEGSAQYQLDASGPVKEYGRFVEELVYTVRDASTEATVMFSLMEFGEETYEYLPTERRDEIMQMDYQVGDHLTQFERGMERFGCSACGELFRGR